MNGDTVDPVEPVDPVTRNRGPDESGQAGEFDELTDQFARCGRRRSVSGRGGVRRRRRSARRAVRGIQVARATRASRLRQLPTSAQVQAQADAERATGSPRRGVAAGARRGRSGVSPLSRRGRAVAEPDADRAEEARPGSRRPRRQPFDPEVAEAVAHEPGDGGEPVVAEVLRSGYLWKGRVLRAGDGQDAGLSSGRGDMAAQREWYEKDYYKVLGVGRLRPPRRSPRRTASSPANCTPTRTRATPRPRKGSRRSPRRTTCSATMTSATSTTRSAGWDRCRWVAAPAGARAASRSTSATWTAASATSSATCSAGAARRAGRVDRASGAGAGPRRGADVTAVPDGRLQGCHRAAETTLHLTTDAQCSTCHGSGAKPGTSPAPAPTAAVVVSSTTTRACSRSPRRAACAGQGTVIDEPCPTCRGLGVEKRQREVSTRLPAGVKDGQTIRLKGRGAPGSQRWPDRRPARRAHGHATPAVRTQRRRPHRHGADHVRRGDPRCRHRGPHARRSSRSPCGSSPAPRPGVGIG